MVPSAVYEPHRERHAAPSPDAGELQAGAHQGTAHRAGPGLVSSRTSGTPPGSVRVDPRASRLARMRRRVLTGARLHVAQGARWRAAMLTLTYRPGVMWDGRHVSECLRHMRQWLQRRGLRLRYVWVLETTKAGAPHYHVVVWLPWGVKLPFLDAAGWWPHGMTRMEWARCAVGYVSKYVSKGEAHAPLPAGARMYGVGGLVGEALDEARWWARPAWLRLRVARGARLARLPGGGWLDRDTGEIYTSPWCVLFRAGVVWLVPRLPAPV